MFGKFQACPDPEVGEQLYADSLEGGCDDEAGEAGEQGWMGLLGDALLFEDSNGFVTYERHDSEALARRRFEELIEA